MAQGREARVSAGSTTVYVPAAPDPPAGPELRPAEDLRGEGVAMKHEDALPAEEKLLGCDTVAEQELARAETAGEADEDAAGDRKDLAGTAALGVEGGAAPLPAAMTLSKTPGLASDASYQ